MTNNQGITNNQKRKIQKWPRREMILFFERLGLYISSGLSLNKALDILIQGAPKKRLKVLQNINREVENGGTLARVLKDSVKISPTILGLVSHGESSGELAKALNFAAELLAREEELLKKCISAMVYPAVIGLFACGLTIGLMKGVMPQIVPMLKSLHVQLPLVTRIVMAISEYLTGYGAFILLLPVLLVCVLFMGYAKNNKLRSIIQTVMVYIPIIGGLTYSYFVSVFLHSLGSLVESGMPLSPAYRDAAKAVSFCPLKNVCSLHVEAIARGQNLGSVLSGFKRLPSFIPSLVSAGELTGSLGTSLSRAATILDKDIEYALRKVTALVEPVMMAGMGFAVGAIALSIMMPIYDVSRVLGH